MKENNLNVPYTPEEIAEECYRAWNEGASLPTSTPEMKMVLPPKIRKCTCKDHRAGQGEDRHDHPGPEWAGQ